MANDTGKLLKTMANDEGTGKKRVPTAIALKSKKRVLPGNVNPDGERNRGGSLR